MKLLNFIIVFNLTKKNNKKNSKSSGNFAQNPKVLEVNLIKDESRVDFEINKKISNTLFVLVMVSLFVAEIYLGLNWWSDYETERVQLAENKFNQISKEIKSLRSESEQISILKKRIDSVEELLDNHVYWTSFFSWLEDNTLSSVNYLGFKGDSNGSYALKASTNNFRDISWQVRALLEDSAVLSVSVDSGKVERPDNEDSAQASAEEVQFELDFRVKPQVFKK